MAKFENLTGKVYSRLTVISQADNLKDRTAWNCQCSCGNTAIVRGSYLKDGRTTSCGCFQKQAARNKLLKHGRSDRVNNKEEFIIYSRETHIMRKYKLSMENYNKMLKDQDNKCFICGYEFGQVKGDTYVDHCHSTKKVRGLLCQGCNSGLGHFKDDTQRLAQAIKYLTKE